MADRILFAAAVLPGLLLVVAGVAGGRGTSGGPAARWLERRRRAAVAKARRPPPLPRTFAAWLALRLDRAGWQESPDRFLALAALVTAGGALVGGVAGSLGDDASAAGGAAAGGLVGAGAAIRALVSAVARRRRRLLSELAPTLELACLELSAGSSAAVALAAVTSRTGGDLSRELRRVLAAAGSRDPLELRLRRLGERLDLPPLTALAAVMATSRDYGSGVVHGVRAIALDLRRAQRRELISSSRSALTRVLVPAAVGVLLPFMAILLFPAISSLAANLR